VQLQDRVEQVHAFFWTCRDNLAMVYRTMFPLNPQPRSLRHLMEKFKGPAEVRDLTRKQVMAGIELALAFVHDAEPTLDLDFIVNRDGVNPQRIVRFVTDAALILLQRLEEAQELELRANREADS